MGCGVQSTDELSNLEQADTVCGSGPTIKGVDVSYYQGNIDWAAAKADGVEYAFVRVSDGTGFEDPKFDQNWAGTRANGILRGAYQYFRPNEDPIAQANLLLARIGTPEANDLPPVIDVETTSGMGAAQVETSVRAWVEHVTAALGKPPIIYTGMYFWRDEVGAPDLTTSPLWHAQYSSVSCPNIAPPWSSWAFWQFTSSGRVEGIAGNVDVNRFNGTQAELMAMTTAPVPCGTIDATGGTIDDGDACFQGGGPQQYLRRIADAGEANDLIWTHTTEAATEANFGHWNLVFAEAGRYQLEVSTPAAYAQSKQARYVIHVAGADHERVVDQSAVDGWQTLGELDVAQGGDQSIHVSDNTGELLADNVQIVFDAVRLTRVGPGSGSGSGSGDEPDEPAPGGCTTGGGAGLALVALLAGLRRRGRSPLSQLSGQPDTSCESGKRP